MSGHRVDGRLGACALGRVLLAQAPGGQPVALTLVRPETAELDGFEAHFHRAAQAAAQVRAPSLVPLLGSGREGAHYWVAAAHPPAVTLRAAGPLPTSVVLRLVAGLADGLRALHDADVVHGDLRPANVLLAADGPLMKEYGFSGLPGFTPLAGEAPAFLSPEQVAGRPATPATDVFALGQIAAYASIGATPFGESAARVRQEEPDLNELPGELREIVTRCLIKDPALRPSLAQITTMCRQAAPPAPSPHPPAAWLPPHLLTPAPSAPTAPLPTSAPTAPPVPGAAPVPVPTPPRAPVPVPTPPRAPVPVPARGYVAPPPAPPVLAPVPVPGAGYVAGPSAPTAAPTPRAMPAPASAAGPPQAVPAGAAGPVAAPRAARRLWRGGVGMVGVLAGVAVAVTAGIALAGGRADPHGQDLGAAPSAAATASGAGASGPTQPPLRGGEVYQGVRLPAGDALALPESPYTLRTGADNGAFGFTAQADAFVSDAHQATLAPLDPALPSAPDSCIGVGGVRDTLIPRGAVTAGSRICVQSVDGTLALVTIRQLPPPGDPEPYALLDVTLWRVAARSAEGDQ
ncbi:protein kinase [Streptomyces sp. V4-01]|uniref:Protein kinase n=1 Tax=Actinacidiphila polyblastidii TaxID=3110430 RepID=A0ABU7PA42_9ACTN|nr:protein kinase [Streptomyces sp. V4-01]